MAASLIIVESPAKARTLKRFLGDSYDVRASMGHVRDLPEKTLSVDVDAGFKPTYEVVESRRKTLGELKTAVGRDREVILKTMREHEPKNIAGVKVESVRDDDGFKFNLADGSWVLLRVSGTEPLVRIYSEAASQEAVKARLDTIQIAVGLEGHGGG